MNKAIAIIIISLLASTNLHAQVGRAAFSQEAQAHARSLMKDPASTQFRNVIVRRDAEQSLNVVCGEVNSKNSFGGYNGFQPFLYMRQDAQRKDEASFYTITPEDKVATLLVEAVCLKKHQ